jgi:Zn finger protein HypA/HybF involved in hydrogenase expression
MEIFEEDPDRPICRKCNIAMWLITYVPKIKDGVETEERVYQCEACGERKTIVV